MIASTSAGVTPWSLGALMCLFVSAVVAWLVARFFWRATPETDETAASPEPEPVTRPSARRFHTAGDVTRWLARRYPHMSHERESDLLESICLDSDRPDFGTDWTAWLEANHERCLERALANPSPRLTGDSRYLPPRDCIVILDVDGAPKRVRASYAKRALGPEWRDEAGNLIDASDVVAWEEVS